MKIVRGRKMEMISSPKMRTNVMVFPGRYGNRVYCITRRHSPDGPVALQGMKFY